MKKLPSMTIQNSGDTYTKGEAAENNQNVCPAINWVTLCVRRVGTYQECVNQKSQSHGS